MILLNVKGATAAMTVSAPLRRNDAEVSHHAVAVSSSPAHARFLSGLTWEGLQQSADGRVFHPGTGRSPPTYVGNRRICKIFCGKHQSNKETNSSLDCPHEKCFVNIHPLTVMPDFTFTHSSVGYPITTEIYLLHYMH